MNIIHEPIDHASLGDTCPLLKIARHYGVDYSVPLKIADHYLHGRDLTPEFIASVPESMARPLVKDCRAVVARMRLLAEVPVQSASTASASPHDSVAQAGSRDGAPKAVGGTPERGASKQ